MLENYINHKNGRGYMKFNFRNAILGFVLVFAVGYLFGGLFNDGGAAALGGICMLGALYMGYQTGSESKRDSES